MADAEEKAREEAEARRRRIMEKSRDRMNKVSGLQQEADADDEETKTSSAARMQAMRRRRFKKGQKAKESSTEESTSAATSTTADGEKKDDGAPTTGEKSAVTSEEKDTAEEKKAPVAPSSTDAAEETKTEGEPAADTTTEPKPEDTDPKEEAPDTAASTDTADAADDTAATQKKYKGVAKMRREKMLQKKKEEAAKAAEEEAKNPTSENPAVVARHKKRMKQQPILPIVMYLLTTLLLFLAGLDVGLQHADESILVNRDFAPQNFNVQKLLPWGSSAPIKTLESDTDLYTRDLSEESDEFSSDSSSVGEDDYVPNIDPLFRVDLDEYTRGPGVFMQLGRGAVKIHRMILFVLWELPLQFLALPSKLFQYPPVMCLSALAIRQVLAKLVLGAKLPETIEEDVRNNKEMTDVLTMIKNAVKNTVVGAFPTAVSLYEAFQFIKADMYVILCGVFVGLLYSTWSLSVNEDGLTQLLMDDAVVPEQELDPVVEETVEDVVVDGMADEL